MMTKRKFRDNLTNDELKEYPVRGYEGEIRIVDSGHDVAEAVTDLYSSPFIGFDTETRPTFRKGERNSVALLQLSGEDIAYLFRLNMTGLTDDLIKLLADPAIQKVGVAIRDDIISLQQLNRFEPGGFVELQDITSGFGIQSAALKKLTAIILGFRISKRQQVTNWENPVLTRAQITYAATDAWVCYQIYKTLFNQSNKI